MTRAPPASPPPRTWRAEPQAPPDLDTPLTARILIVDDDERNAFAAVQALEELGHELVVARSGEDALRRLLTEEFALILLDLHMPGMDGYEVCRRLRQEEWGRQLLIIAQTGWGQQHDRDRTREAGFDHHMVKPIELPDLISLLRER